MNKDTTMQTDRFQYLVASTGSVFTQSDYPRLMDQIEVHKYLVNQRIQWTISWDDAAFSWLENVFQPIMQVVDQWEVRSAFNTKTRSELFFEISDHWYFLMQKNPDLHAQEAAIDYAATYGRGLGRFVSKLMAPKHVA